MVQSSQKRSYSFRILGWLFVWLKKLDLKTKYKRAGYNLRLAKLLIIEDVEKKYSDKSKQFVEDLSRVALNQLFLGEIPKAYGSFNKENQAIIETELESAKRNDKLTRRYTKHLEYQKFLLGSILNSLPPEYPKKKEILDESIRTLTREDFLTETKSDQKEFKKVNKKLRKRAKLERLKERIERVPRIEITSANATIAITLFSVLFLISGFIYCQIFLTYFGIDLSNFFEISDYLAASASRVFYTLGSMTIGLVVLFFIFPEYLYGEIPKKARWAKITDDVLFYVIFVLSAASTVFFFVLKNQEAFLNSLELFLLLFTIFIIPHLLIFFKNPLRAYFVIISVLFFLGSIFFGALGDISSILKKDAVALKKYNFVFSNNTEIDDSNLVLLASPSLPIMIGHSPHDKLM